MIKKSYKIILKPVSEIIFIIKLKYESSTMILHMYSLVLDILCVSYFLASIIMRDRQTGDMRQIRQMMSALSLSSARLSKLRILCLNNLLDGDLCKSIFYFYMFFFSLVFKHDFIGCLYFTRIPASNKASDDVTN